MQVAGMESWSVPLKIERIEHFSINCIDYQKSRKFYEGILGFKFMETVDCGEFDISYFALPGGSRLELFDYRGKNQVVSHEESESGLRHVAFLVEDVAAHERELRAAGVEIVLPTCDLPNLGARVLLFMDPNSVVLEFCEKLN
jgi:catechol 2,3-dioxygenase-like lactoylglutathione lyase family enzyme